MVGLDEAVGNTLEVRRNTSLSFTNQSWDQTGDMFLLFPYQNGVHNPLLILRLLA